jgi:hypothetical protein
MPVRGAITWRHQCTIGARQPVALSIVFSGSTVPP